VIGRLLVLAAGGRASLDDALRGVPHAVRCVTKTRDAVTSLIDEPPPRPQILVVDFDALTATDVLELHAIRERGWFGSIIALGDVSADLRRSLAIEHVVALPLAGATLRRAIARVGIDQTTRQMTPLRR
jgi:hypothetical protein